MLAKAPQQGRMQSHRKVLGRNGKADKRGHGVADGERH
jgi:hypothetical protein